jgi:uncharacterized protein (DUF1330 family)
MAAYIVVDIEVLEPVEYEDYKKRAAQTVEKYGGRYIVRGGPVQVIEGEWTPKRFVILEFPSMEQAKAWYDSAEYSGPKAVRHRTARSNLIMVEGTKQA